MNMPSKEILERRLKWIEALTSNRFNQGHEYLRESDYYCCLGVACEIFKEEVGLEWDEYEYAFYLKVHDLEESEEYYNEMPPARLRSFLGFTNQEFQNLAMLNDNGLTFEQIARIISLLDYEENITRLLSESQEDSRKGDEYAQRVLALLEA